MGRTEPSVGKPPASFRRDARAKRAKATTNKVVPAVLAAHPRARRGVEAAELIADPPPNVRGSAPRGHARAGSDDGVREGDKRKVGSGDGNDNTSGSRNGSAESNGNIKGPCISLCIADTLSTASSLLLVPSPSSPAAAAETTQETAQEQRRDLSNATARVGVLNMASPLAAGGGFLNGAAGQEEASLCARTTLLPSLRDEFYRLPEVGGVFTPDVLVFRGVGGRSAGSRGKTRGKGKEKGKGKGEEDEKEGGKGEKGEGRGGGDDEEAELLPKRERWFVDVVTAAMLRLPEVEVDEETGWASYASAQDRELAVRKMRGVLRIFASKGVKRVVLGAWGCGAYGNPVGEIARAWRKVLRGGAGIKEVNRENKEGQRKGKKGSKEKAVESWDGIERIVFAIKDAGMARAFATAFGEDLLDGYGDNEEEDGDLSDGESDEEDEKVKELRGKIRELELQVEQVRTPQLRSGLNSVLAGLRSQLPDHGDHTQHDTVDDENDKSSRDGVSGSED
ncbi:uncharacterized protein F4807DRAFT_244206 [Annulohypoxylon truncatum]|uniref:uncharacterized protein n=1 Tax=Annulohypoxylon truncatum TaxID=327061 RepID=UPI0020087C80|nr:uncharacterized protein F4807DRAFT_244206 [Annulohypoxylon truncatum]KAI1206067.1 hypothetical protein F4807DRAFT_244206 [Annulohypoxylon truncatum]